MQGANPIARIDPSGQTFAQLLTGFGIEAILARMLVGGIIGALDAKFRNYSLTEGVVNGAIGGAIGPLIPWKIGLVLGVAGVVEALWAKDYDAALFRAGTLGFGWWLQTRGFPSYPAFKKFFGPAGRGKAFHHIVEQTPQNITRFGPERIHNPCNITPVEHGPGTLHGRISGFMSSKQPAVTGSPNLTVRQWLATRSFEEQYQFGLETLQRFGGSGPMNVLYTSTQWIWPATLAWFADDPTSAEDADGVDSEE